MRAIVVVLALLSSSAAADEFDRGVLRSLKGVHVSVRFGGEAPPGLTPESLKTAAELVLRRNGVPLVPEGRLSTSPRTTANLDVSIVWTTANERMYALSMRTSVIQRVLLPAGFVWPVEIWSRASVAVSGTHVVEERVRAGLVEFVEDFANDFLAANPRRVEAPAAR